MPALRTRDTSRSLEVTTDAPAPPSLAIVSPTPRAFAFPISHNLSDSPYSSPSSSPFEPDHHHHHQLQQPPSFTFHSNSTTVSIPTPPPFPPQPSYGQRSFTPDSLRSASPTPSQHKRRKSSCSSDSSERRPKKGDEDYIKRPENAFILFRRKCCEDRQQAAEEAAHMADGPQKKQRQADLSKTISQQWKGLGAEERQYWETLAKEKKKEHEQMYPNYVYRPQRTKDKDGRSSKKKSTSKHRRDEDELSVSFVVPVAPRNGRSASAPTPPPYQAIRIPQVYHLPHGSAPTSPSLLPMISRQSAQMHGDLSNGFDFLPTNAYVAPGFGATGQNGQIDPSFQSAEFLRSMFTMPNQVRKLGASPLEQVASPLSLICPPSSVSSGSSSPASPNDGPFTPSSAPLPHSFLSMPTHDFDTLLENTNGNGNNHQTQAEIDLQAEMQLQHDFSQFTWGWPSSAPATLDNNWDVNSIPSALLGEQGKFTNDDLCSTGLEFGQDFAHALESNCYTNSDPTLLSGYDDLMAGTAFSV